MVWHKVTELLGLSSSADQTAQSDRDLALATAALLVQVSVADGSFDASEKLRLLEELQSHFGLSDADATHILTEAETAHGEASSLYKFTRVVTAELDQDGRQEIVRLLWRIAFADNVIDNFEANALAKIANLLGVSTEDRIRLKHEVRAETP